MKVDKNFIKKGTFFKKSKFLKINFSIADNIHKNVLKMGAQAAFEICQAAKDN